MKLDKSLLERKINLMAQEGIVFKTGVFIGQDVELAELKKENDAVILATGATVPRDLNIPGRNLEGIDFAMSKLFYSSKKFVLV
jgi:glutamate synthase (NADPH/NADH)